MKEITVISGKGGTGKTTVTAALASAGKGLVLCDGDVDAPDLHLILDPKVLESHLFEGNWVASVQADLCGGCRICADYCRFDAFSFNDRGMAVINPFKCEGCRLCERICPSEAIHSQRSSGNYWFLSSTRHGTMVHARMGAGEENSGKLVTKIRHKAKEIAQQEKADVILTDGPPGTGCPAIAAISGTDLVLLVMEPSRSSLHDAARVIELIDQFHIPMVAAINKYDLHPGLSAEIEEFLKNRSIRMASRIPFDENVVQAMVAARSIIEFAPRSESAFMIRRLWEEIL